MIHESELLCREKQVSILTSLTTALCLNLGNIHCISETPINGRVHIKSARCWIVCVLDGWCLRSHIQHPDRGWIHIAGFTLYLVFSASSSTARPGFPDGRGSLCRALTEKRDGGYWYTQQSISLIHCSVELQVFIYFALPHHHFKPP